MNVVPEVALVVEKPILSWIVKTVVILLLLPSNLLPLAVDRSIFIQPYNRYKFDVRLRNKVLARLERYCTVHSGSGYDSGITFFTHCCTHWPASLNTLVQGVE